MPNNNEAPPSGEKIFIQKPEMISYQWSFEMFHIICTVFKLLAKIGLMATETPPSEENIIHRKSDTDLLLVVC
jgi:hypothetical protein